MESPKITSNYSVILFMTSRRYIPGYIPGKHFKKRYVNINQFGIVFKCELVLKNDYLLIYQYFSQPLKTNFFSNNYVFIRITKLLVFI